MSSRGRRSRNLSKQIVETRGDPILDLLLRQKLPMLLRREVVSRLHSADQK
jgi:hypothetical protein